MADICVIIPNYNHEHLIYDAIGSIRNQTIRSKTYHALNYRVVSDYPRMGKGYRMNQVVPHVIDEWLNVHDADDMSSNNRFEVCAEYFDNYDVIYHDIYVWDGTNWVVRVAPDWDRERYKRESFICASTVIVRSEIARKVRWETNTYGQDWIWFNLVAEHTDRFKRVPEPLLYYRGHFGFTQHLKLKRFRRWMLRRKIARLTS